MVTENGVISIIVVTRIRTSRRLGAGAFAVRFAITGLSLKSLTGIHLLRVF